MKIGTSTVTAIYLGTTSISSAYLGNTQVFGGSFTPLSLFSTGAQGIWLDPSDLTTMFSDRAGTTPVTTPGTVVGLRLDKSKGLALGAELVTNGTFDTDLSGWTVAAAATGSSSWAAGSMQIAYSAALPAARYQALSVTAGKTYNLKCGYSVVSGTAVKFFLTVKDTASVTSGALAETLVTASSGASGSISFYYTAASTRTVYVMGLIYDVAGTINFDNISVRELAGNHAVAPTDAARPIYGVEPKGGRRNLLLATDTMATQSLTVTAVAHTLAFTGTGTVTLTGASTAGPLVGTGAGNRVSLTFTPTAASLTLTVSGSVTLGQLELGSSATAYQKVVTAYNVTESGVDTCHYVQFDGSDDSMSTAAIDFTATDKMSVFAGVRKLSDAAIQLFYELSANVNTNNGTFNSLPGYSGIGSLVGAYWNGGSKGSVLANAVSAATFSAPSSAVQSHLMDISGDRSTLRINGAQVAQETTDQGTGNFGNYPLFIGRRGNSALPFSGKDYGIIVVGKAASGTEITDTETWLAARTAQVTL